MKINKKSKEKGEGDMHELYDFPGILTKKNPPGIKCRSLTHNNFSFYFQKELFSSKVESADTGRDRKMSSSSTGSMKSKWMKAFKSLKTPPTNGTAAKESEK